MDSQLFMRVRGRVLGPYDQEKLQSLARRGQLSRMHEVSTDGVNWVRASNYPDLFISAPVGSAVAETVPSETNASTDSPGNQWHYTSGGVERGPIDFFNLQMLVGTGQLTEADLVWSQGMAAWTPV